jgi:iron complex transport system substrate-binding protein
MGFEIQNTNSQPLPSPKGDTRAKQPVVNLRWLFVLALVSPLGDGRGGTSANNDSFLWVRQFCMRSFKWLATCLSIAIIILPSCQTQTQQQTKKPCTKTSSLPIKYAKGFAVDYYDGFKIITIRDLKDSAKVLQQFVLLPANKPAPVGFENAELISTPIHKTVCVSISTTGEMGVLNLLDSIAGVTNAELIYNQQLLEKIKTNQIADVGKQEINYEKLVELHPAFVFTSGGYDGGDTLQLKLTSLHIESVPDLDFKEQDPLARAEWIKFIAAFYGNEKLADRVFNGIESRYLLLKTLAAKATTQPTVFCNLPFKEIWYMPCGENYMAQLIADAGGNFLWKDAKATNGLNLNLDYEAVYNKAANAGFWINTGFAASLHDIETADKKNTLFKAYKTGNIYTNNKRNTIAGGFDFWESGAVKPDEILADLITIFHPELLKDHDLYYYQKLR